MIDTYEYDCNHPIHVKDKKKDTSFLLYTFPNQKKQIAKLSYDEKMEWYQSRDSQEMVWLGNSHEFQRFWHWHVVLPVKLRRLYYRIKNGEIFKHYQPITEMKKKIKKHSI